MRKRSERDYQQAMAAWVAAEVRRLAPIVETEPQLAPRPREHDSQLETARVLRKVMRRCN